MRRDRGGIDGRQKAAEVCRGDKSDRRLGIWIEKAKIKKKGQKAVYRKIVI